MMAAGRSDVWQVTAAHPQTQLNLEQCLWPLSSTIQRKNGSQAIKSWIGIKIEDLVDSGSSVCCILSTNRPNTKRIPEDP